MSKRRSAMLSLILSPVTLCAVIPTWASEVPARDQSRRACRYLSSAVCSNSATSRLRGPRRTPGPLRGRRQRRDRLAGPRGRSTRDQPEVRRRVPAPAERQHGSRQLARTRAPRPRAALRRAHVRQGGRLDVRRRQHRGHCLERPLLRGAFQVGGTPGRAATARTCSWSSFR